MVNVIFTYRVVRSWLQAMMGGAPISVMTLMGMIFRRVDHRIVINQGVSATQAGFPIGWAELERAYLTGVDLEKAVLAYITAKKQEKEFSFEEIVDAARESRLVEMISR